MPICSCIPISSQCLLLPHPLRALPVTCHCQPPVPAPGCILSPNREVEGVGPCWEYWGNWESSIFLLQPDLSQIKGMIFPLGQVRDDGDLTSVTFKYIKPRPSSWLRIGSGLWAVATSLVCSFPDKGPSWREQSLLSLHPRWQTECQSSPFLGPPGQNSLPEHRP